MTLDANQTIRDAMRQAVRERGLTHAQLAALLGIKQPSVTQLLQGGYGNIPQSLLQALNVLGLELQVVPKQDAEDPNAALARAEALALLSCDPWGKKPLGLENPATFDGPAFEEVLREHRGPEV